MQQIRGSLSHIAPLRVASKFSVLILTHLQDILMKSGFSLRINNLIYYVRMRLKLTLFLMMVLKLKATLPIEKTEIALVVVLQSTYTPLFSSTYVRT